jgi:hypothetical protein
MFIKNYLPFWALFFLGLAIPTLSTAQVKGGVKIGLNISSLKGPAEVDPDKGTVLETTESYTGFHMGPSFSVPFSDRFGLRGELLYSKKGFQYQYEGLSPRRFTYDNNQGLGATIGQTNLGLSVNFVNLDVPLMAYARLGKVELSGGAYLSLLFQKVAEGIMQYSWKNLDGTEGQIEQIQVHNYNKDAIGGADGGETIVTRVNGRNVTLPRTVGAYYDFIEDKGNLYRTLDYGLLGGASFYISSTLYIGARLQYGLVDLTNNNADMSRYLGFPFNREDKDYNYNIQVSVGFNL